METNPIGHNNPPTDAEILKTTLADKHSKLFSRANDLISAADRIPATIADADTAGKISDYIKQLTGSKKNLEAERVNEKEPYLTLGRVVDGYFKQTTDALDGAAMKAKRPLDSWLKLKAEEERRARVEEARLLREKQEQEERDAKMLQDAKLKPEADKMLDQAIITEQVAIKAEAAVQAKPAELAHSRGTSGALASLRTRWVGELVDVGAIDLEKLRHHLNPDALQKAINSYVSAGGRELSGVNIYEKSETVVR